LSGIAFRFEFGSRDLSDDISPHPHLYKNTMQICWYFLTVSVLSITHEFPCPVPSSTRNCGFAGDLATGCEWTQWLWRIFRWIL